MNSTIYSTEGIVFETLLPLRDYMSRPQLERFGDYILRRTPAHPFTWHELYFLNQKKQLQLLIREIDRSVKEYTVACRKAHELVQESRRLVRLSKHSRDQDIIEELDWAMSA